MNRGASLLFSSQVKSRCCGFGLSAAFAFASTVPVALVPALIRFDRI